MEIILEGEFFFEFLLDFLDIDLLHSEQSEKIIKHICIWNIRMNIWS